MLRKDACTWKHSSDIRYGQNRDDVTPRDRHRTCLEGRYSSCPTTSSTSPPQDPSHRDAEPYRSCLQKAQARKRWRAERKTWRRTRRHD